MATVAQTFKFGIKRNTGSWGGAAMLLGAGDGVEGNNYGIKANVELIDNKGIFGVAFQRPGSPGNLKPAGDWEADLFYDDSFWRGVSAPMGLDTPVDLGGAAAFRHDITQLSSHTGKFHTIAAMDASGGIGVFELNTAKVTGFKLKGSADGDGQRVKGTLMLASHDENLNVGVPDAAFVFASVAVNNGSQTILAQAQAIFNPSPLTITKAAGVSAINAIITYENRFGDIRTYSITVADFVSNVWTSVEYARRVISIVTSATAGAGNISGGITNGINRTDTSSGVTTSAVRFPVLFGQAHLFWNAQGGADFVAGDELCIAGFEIGVDLKVDSRVNTCQERRIAEPTTGGTGFAEVTVSFNFDELVSGNNRQRFFDAFQKNQSKVKLVCSGPQIGATAFNHALTLWLNGVQISGEPVVGQAGLLKWDVTGRANQVLAVPTGFPASDISPLLIQLVNAVSTAYTA
jgi:hypothetical protein